MELDGIYFVFDEMFGLTMLKAFFKECLENRWNKVQKWSLHLLLWVMHPVYFFGQAAAFFLTDGDLIPGLLDLVIYLQLFQTWFKTIFLIFRADKLMTFYLKSMSESVWRYRRQETLRSLGKSANWLKKVCRISYTFVYTNLVYWAVIPLLLELPFFSPDVTAYRMVNSSFTSLLMTNSYLINKIILLFEIIVHSVGIIHFLALDLFMTAIVTIYCTHIRTLNKSMVPCFRPNDFLLISEEEELEDEEELDQPMPFKEFIKGHQHMIKVYKEISKTLSPLLVILLLCDMLIICILTFLIQATERQNISATEKTIHYLRYITFVSCSVGHLFLYCWLCTKLKEARESTHLAVYSTPWYEKDRDYKVNMLILLVQVKNSKPITAMDLAKIELGTFIDVMRLSYSYYTFLRGFVL